MINWELVWSIVIALAVYAVLRFLAGVMFAAFTKHCLRSSKDMRTWFRDRNIEDNQLCEELHLRK